MVFSEYQSVSDGPKSVLHVQSSDKGNPVEFVVRRAPSKLKAPTHCLNWRKKKVEHHCTCWSEREVWHRQANEIISANTRVLRFRCGVRSTGSHSNLARSQIHREPQSSSSKSEPFGHFCSSSRIMAYDFSVEISEPPI